MVWPASAFASTVSRENATHTPEDPARGPSFPLLWRRAWTWGALAQSLDSWSEGERYQEVESLSLQVVSTQFFKDDKQKWENREWKQQETGGLERPMPHGQVIAPTCFLPLINPEALRSLSFSPCFTLSILRLRALIFSYLSSVPTPLTAI